MRTRKGLLTPIVLFTAAQVWVFPTPAAGGASDVQETRTFFALADTYSKADEPDRNFGASWQIRVDASPQMWGFLRFDPDGLGTPINQAILRVYANSASYGIDLHSVSGVWDETTLSHGNIPQFDSIVASSGRILARTWAEWDVTSLVSGNDPVSFALTSFYSTATSLAARESRTTVPELVVTFGEGDGGGDPDTTRPSAPTDLSATAVGPGRIDVTWNASTDNVGVTGYEIFRNGSLHATTTGATSYSDTTVVSSATYRYEVRARDGAGLYSGFSNMASITTPEWTPPSAPTDLTASPVGSGQVDLSWTSSTDNVGVTGYEIFRDGVLLTAVGTDTVYSDEEVTPSTTYKYQVRARDEAGNRSEFSNTATVTTPEPGQGPTTRLFNAVADTYSKGDEPDRNFGRSGQIRVDASPDMRGFLRFEIENLGGPVVTATLRIYANSANSVGIDVRGVSDDSWGETSLTYRNMPVAGAVVDSSGPITAGTWVEWDVGPLISGNHPVSFALTTTSPTATSLAARETGLTRPELVIVYEPGVVGPPPPEDLEPASPS
jgi:chitodextrinase